MPTAHLQLAGFLAPQTVFVVAESLILRINICGKNPAHRKSIKCYNHG